jgi:hypothetical protein
VDNEFELDQLDKRQLTRVKEGSKSVKSLTMCGSAHWTLASGCISELGAISNEIGLRPHF